MIRPLAHGEQVDRHLDALATSSRLTATYRRMYRPMATEVYPEDVIRVLNSAGVRPVLMGTHGIGGWRSQARATEDVDVLVKKKDLKKAIRALKEAYPQLKFEDYAVVARFRDPASGRSVIDVMKPTQDVYRLALRHTIPVGATHDIPDLEMALASKFAAMVSPRREVEKKLIDGGDFVDVVKNNRKVLDLPRLRRLAERIYRGGAVEIGQMIEDIDAGRMIKF